MEHGLALPGRPHSPVPENMSILPASRYLRVLTVNIHKGYSAFNRRSVLHGLREAVRDVVLPPGATTYDTILWRLEKEGASTLELTVPVADGERIEATFGAPLWSTLQDLGERPWQPQNAFIASIYGLNCPLGAA